VLSQKVIGIGAARTATISRFSNPDFIRNLPDLPVFPDTLLKLELAVGERPVELARISSLILADPGAAIQVMRLARREWDGGTHPDRIEDCICGLGLQACLDAISKRTIARCRRNQAVVRAWDHAGAIAWLSGIVAEEQASAATTEEAKWVGLCHEIGSLPDVLGWSLDGKWSVGCEAAGLAMAEAWSLPQCVVDYFSDRLAGNPQSPWTALVDQAHQQIEGEVACRMENSPLPLDLDSMAEVEAI
jgi:hypothetical protein